MLQLWRNCSMSSDRGGVKPKPLFSGVHLPPWPQGGGFAKGRIGIGELEVTQITSFQSIWTFSSSRHKGNGATFYKPVGVPDGFSVLGHYCRRDDRPLHGYVLAARARQGQPGSALASVQTPLCNPQDYMLVWSCNALSNGGGSDGDGYFWLPLPPEGYEAVGFLVTTRPEKPSVNEVSCICADLTDECEAHNLLLNVGQMQSSDLAFSIWSIRPVHRGMWGKGVNVGTFCCAMDRSSLREQGLACLKNIKLELSAMPNLEQVHALIQHYGPIVFFHPKEVYLPSSVSWFFENGASLYKKGGDVGEEIANEGSNLPAGGCNDGEYWIDLPGGTRGHAVKHGDIENAELYAHVKPAWGGEHALTLRCGYSAHSMAQRR